MEVLESLVPTKTITTSSKTHPWLNDRCRQAIDQKLAAHGTLQEIEMRDRCSQILTEEYDKHLNRVRQKLSRLPRSSRSWWKLANSLAGKRSKSSGIQPLQKPDGEWVRTAESKAELLAATFEKKSKLPDPTTNAYTAIGAPEFAEDTFLPIRTRDARRALTKLKAGSATGPGGLSARMLKA